MPIYEYACTSCGERTEAKQGFDDPPLETCPHCGGKLRKLYSPVGIVFKGSGFYSTDQKSKKSSASGDSKPSSEGGADKKATEPAKSDSSSKSDTKTSSSTEKSA
ncbi:MAG TPA: FmdB family zinc ribbon protein [Actinomycetota bacterium]